MLCPVCCGTTASREDVSRNAVAAMGREHAWSPINIHPGAMGTGGLHKEPFLAR